MKRITNSEMKAWHRCKRRWWLEYHRGLKPVAHSFGKPTDIGDRVHGALAVYYSPVAPGDPLATLRAGIDADIAEYPDAAADITQAGELATIMVEGYLNWLADTGEDSNYRVLSAEGKREAYLFDSDRGRVNLLSKLDARVLRLNDGARLALEHKTVQDFSTPVGALVIDPQCLTEHLVEYLAQREQEAATGEPAQRTAGVLFNMLRKVKRTARANPPFYKREPVLHNETQLLNHWRHVVAVAQAVEQAATRLDRGEDHHVVAEPTPTRDCTWDCPFFHCCVMFDDGSDAEGYLAEEFAVHDPLERYDSIEEAGV